jgi:hypothetical protein
MYTWKVTLMKKKSKEGIMDKLIKTDLIEEQGEAAKC